MLNRAALTLKYRAAMVRWINETDPNRENSRISADELNQERTVYLIAEVDADDEEPVEMWIRRNFELLFDIELERWYTDRSLWPSERTLALFRDWFEVEYHSVVIDTVAGEIYDDEA